MIYESSCACVIGLLEIGVVSLALNGGNSIIKLQVERGEYWREVQFPGTCRSGGLLSMEVLMLYEVFFRAKKTPTSWFSILKSVFYFLITFFLDVFKARLSSSSFANHHSSSIIIFQPSSSISHHYLSAIITTTHSTIIISHKILVPRQLTSLHCHRKQDCPSQRIAHHHAACSHASRFLRKILSLSSTQSSVSRSKIQTSTGKSVNTLPPRPASSIDKNTKYKNA